MIIFILNEPFFYNGGFSKRCQREVNILSQYDEVTVISRGEKLSDVSNSNKHIRFVSYDISDHSVEYLKKYTVGLGELYTSAKLFFPLLRNVYRVTSKHSKEKKNLKVYVISSPMTVALFCLFITKFFGIKNTVLEFHDLEPEMAIHIKQLKKTSFFLQIEYFLEKIVCKQYTKIIVTNKIQAKILKKRTKINENKIFVLPNAVTKEEYKKRQEVKKMTSKLFRVGYISTLRFEYTFLGLIALIEKMVPVFGNNPNIELIIIGDGKGIAEVKETIAKYNLEKNVIVLGNVSNVSRVLASIDIGIIPWIHDDFSNTLLPTKLFEYLASQIPVIVPDFGAFPEVIKNNENGLLFTTIDDLVKKIVDLKKDNAKRKTLAENGYSLFLKHYALNNYNKNYSNFLEL